MMEFLRPDPYKIAMDLPPVVLEFLRTEQWPTAMLGQLGLTQAPMEFILMHPYKTAMGFLRIAMESTPQSLATAMGEPREPHLQRTELRPLLALVVWHMAAKKTSQTNI